MKLSVIILNYNVRYFLELCLKSVEAAVSDINSEIIVVDNNSTDDSCQMVKSLFPNVVLIENKVNYGFSKGNNLGVAKAKGDYICILNPDTVVAEDTFNSLLTFADGQSNLGIIGCRLVDGSGTFLPESKRNIPLPRVALKKLIGNSSSYYANQIEELETGMVPILVGAFMLMKKQVFYKANGFDEDYFMYGEDIDLSYKIHNLGYDNFYNGTTTIVHFKGESTLKDNKYATQFYGAMQVFYKKHFKRNILFDALVWLGIRIAYLSRSEPKNIVEPTNEYIMVSNKIPKQMFGVLHKPIKLVLDLENINQHTEVILDGNLLTNKKIIAYLTNHKNCKAKFKILPKNSNFIIGSCNSKSRGEVVIFKDI